MKKAVGTIHFVSHGEVFGVYSGNNGKLSESFIQKNKVEFFKVVTKIR